MIWLILAKAAEFSGVQASNFFCIRFQEKAPPIPSRDERRISFGIRARRTPLNGLRTQAFAASFALTRSISLAGPSES